MLDLKREVYDAMLPPTPCRSEMRQRVDDIAEENKTSVAAVIRSAVSLFLETYAPKPSEESSRTEPNGR